MNNQVYIVRESTILKISQLMGCLENVIKELIRSDRDMPDDFDFIDDKFYELTSRNLVSLDADRQIRSYSRKRNTRI